MGGGPPIVAAGLIWTIGQNGDLYGLDPTTGAVEEHASIGTEANHFPTPAVGAGLLLAPVADRVVAFSAPSAGRVDDHLPTTTSPTTTSTTAARTTTTVPATTTSAPEPAGGSNTGAIVAAVIGGLVVVAGLVWLLVRQRRRRQ